MTRHTPNLGILYAEESGRGLTHPFFVLILNAIKGEAASRGYDITFIHPGTDEDCAEHCRRGGIDGVCMVCLDFRAPQFKALAESEIPCVTIDHIYKRVPAVLSDNETGVQKLVEYAIKKGHRRIAFIHGHDNSVVTRTRISQFNNTMAYHDLPVPQAYIKQGLYDAIGLTRKLVLELLRLPERPTCILLPDDVAYLGAQEAAWEMNLRIPEDISFCGYDGIPLTQAMSPRLTTIRQSSEDIGRTAARRLIELIEAPETASRKPTIFPVELVEGGTIGEV
jgi:DNA-binding LacI/PurR family transcriptional regulator